MLNGHGNSRINIDVPIITDFSSNIWYRGLNDKLCSVLQDKVRDIVNYPVVDASSLQTSVAKTYALNDSQVCVTNGATEAFYLVAHAFSGKKSLVLYPSFSEYNDAAELYNHSIAYLSNSDLDKIVLSDADLVWIGNPNNPDGKIISQEFIQSLLEQNPNKVFVVDEAYAEVCNNFNSAIELIDRYNNLIIIKSMTKQCVIPGLRLGYFISNTELRNKIAAYRMPWSVNSLALEAGTFIFNNLSEFTIDTKYLLKESIAFQKGMNNIDGVEVVPSDTNYFLCKIKDKTATVLQNFLINKYGFLIRNASNFKGLNDSYFRVAIQGENNNEQCVNAIKEFLSND